MATSDSGNSRSLQFILIVCCLSFLPILAFYHRAHGLPTLLDVYSTTYRTTHRLFKGNKDRLDELRELLLLQNLNISDLMGEVQKGHLYKAKFESLKEKGLQVTKELLELQGQVETLQQELVEANRQLYSRKSKGTEEIKRLNTTYIKYFSEFKKKLKKLKEDKERQIKVNERLEDKLEKATHTIRELQQSKQGKSDGEILPQEVSCTECLKKMKLLETELMSLKQNRDSKSSEIMLTEDDDNTQVDLNDQTQQLSEHEDAVHNRGSLPDSADEMLNTQDSQYYTGNSRNRLVEQERSEHTELPYNRKPNHVDEIPSRYRHRFETFDSGVYRGNNHDNGYRYGIDSRLHGYGDLGSAGSYGMNSRSNEAYGMNSRSNEAYGVNSRSNEAYGIKSRSKEAYGRTRSDYGYGMSSRPNDEWAVNDNFDLITSNGHNQGNDDPRRYPSSQYQDFGNPRAARKCEKPVFNADREGSSYFQKGVTSARNCQMLCKKDPECSTWVYVKARAMCYLKDFVSPPVPTQCCISGVC